MKSVVIGASAGLGRALAEQLAEAGHDLFLVATDARDLEAQAADLRIRFTRKVSLYASDIKNVRADVLRDACRDSLGKPDCLFLVSGRSDLDRDFELLTEDDVESLVSVNLMAPIKIALAFLPDLIASEHGACVGIGSAAQTRPRSKNTVYAASKSGLEFFFSGMLQTLTWTRCRVQFYRIGYMDTQMTFGIPSVVPYANPQDIARYIVKNLSRDSVGTYLPRWWGILMLVYAAIPWFIFRRMKS